MKTVFLPYYVMFKLWWQGLCKAYKNNLMCVQSATFLNETIDTSQFKVILNYAIFY